MKFFKKGDKVLIKSCGIKDYAGLTGTVIYHKKDSIHIAIDEKFHMALHKYKWVVNPVFTNNFVKIVSIENKILNNE